MPKFIKIKKLPWLSFNVFKFISDDNGKRFNNAVLLYDSEIDSIDFFDTLEYFLDSYPEAGECL